ncbi:hypothetical protein FKX85_10085 [Echinicola soli]|uniref:Uncharacterized protein n=1 Tax=Echinicola soli TaxID=2591634 RepID=A0A514CHS6_9BACT|nr:hypothetical protein [Echinicola soli]QDH79365.1 hypothetical protein FKX85_10085 [Echinicola soli]
MTFHSKSNIGEAQLWIISTNFNSTTDSTIFYLPENGSVSSLEWKPEFSGTEGFIVCGVAGREDLRDTIGHYDIIYPNGVLINKDYWITVTADSLNLERFE